jgi:drug/metabolite transporter (DMT)-like permease
MRPRDVFAYVFLAVVWGFSFLLVLKVVAAFGWVGAVSLRALVAGSTLFALAAATRRRLNFSFGWPHLIVVGATTVAGQLLGLSYATPRIGTAMAAILVAPIPLFSMVIGRIWGLERISLNGLVGLILGFVGLVMLVGFPVVPITGLFLLGCASSLFGSLSAAFGSIYASRYLRGASSWEITAGSFLAGGLMTLPLLSVVPVPAAPQPVDYVWLVLLACLMSSTTYIVYFRLVADIGATRAISVEFAVTVMAVIVGAVVLHERLSPIQLAGGAVIILGCALVLGLVPLPALRRT